jgi:replicative DNA helicase
MNRDYCEEIILGLMIIDNPEFREYCFNTLCIGDFQSSFHRRLFCSIGLIDSIDLPQGSWASALSSLAYIGMNKRDLSCTLEIVNKTPSDANGHWYIEELQSKNYAYSFRN